VGICHRDKNGGSNYIEVSAGAVPMHQKHGDVVTNLTDESNCGACGNDCGEYLECCNGRCTYLEEYFQDDSANCGGCGKACVPGSACLDGVCIDVQDNVANCGAVRHDCRAVYNSNEVDCVDGSCYRLCGGDVCADGACYAMCIEPICVGREPSCGRFYEKCCASHDLASIECFGPDRCPTTTQRFIEVR
jgi:hypothetical protein